MTKKIIVLAALTALGLAAILILNPFAPAPEKVIKEMRLKMAGLSTFHNKSVVNLTIAKANGENFKISLVANNDNDKTDPQNIKQTGNFNASVATEGMQFYLGGENIIMGNDSYVKLTTVPALPMIEPILRMMGINVSDFKNQWIKIDKESFGNLPGGKEAQADKIAQELQALFLTSEFYAVKQEMPAEKINGQKAYHYLVSLEKEGTKNLLLEAIKVLAQNQEESFNPSEEELAEFSLNFDEFFDKIGGLDAELWIGQKDKFLYKFALTKEIDSSNFDESIAEEGLVTVNTVIELSNFNQPFNIAAPNDAKPLQSFFGNYLESMSSSLETANKYKIISDMNQIRSAAAMIEIDENNYAKLSCAHADLKAICREIKEISGAEPIIRPSLSGEAYCAYVELNEGKFYCVDSQLRALETSDNPSQKKYCDGKTFVCPPEINY